MGRSQCAEVTADAAATVSPDRRRGDDLTLHNAEVGYDVELAERVRAVVRDEPDLTEKRMFGGLAFLIQGNMAVSASSQGGLLLRVDPAETDALVEDPAARRFVMRGREMDGWLRVDAAGLSTDRQLRQWVTRGVEYARSLPPKR